MTVTGPAPATSGGVDWNSLVGSLLFFDVGILEVGITTPFGVSDAIRCDVTVLDGTHAGTTHENILVFSGLKRQLTPMTKVVGRLTQGQARPGQNPPWKLADPTPDELQRAVAWDQRRSAPTAPAAVPDITPNDHAPF